MVVRLAFFVLMSLGLIGFGTVAWLTTRPAGFGGPPTTRMILIATQAIPGGSLLNSDDMTPKEIPIDEIIKEYNLDTPEFRRALMGAMVKRNLSQGEAIRSDDLMRPTDHGFMAAVLSPGMRAVTINVDPASGSSGLIWPGDRIDLILTQVNADPSAPLGKRVSAHTVLTNVRVVAVDAQMVTSSTRNAVANPDPLNRTVTLEVDEEQVQRVSVGMRLGRLSVSVRSASTVQGRAKTEKSEATWAMDVLPELTEKPLPPAPVVVMAPPPPPPPPPPKPPDTPMRVFSGPGEAKEFKF